MRLWREDSGGTKYIAALLTKILHFLSHALSFYKEWERIDIVERVDHIQISAVHHELIVKIVTSAHIL